MTVNVPTSELLRLNQNCNWTGGLAMPYLVQQISYCYKMPYINLLVATPQDLSENRSCTVYKMTTILLLVQLEDYLITAVRYKYKLHVTYNNY